MLLDLFGPEAERVLLPLTRLKEVSVFHSILGYAPVKALLPLPILAAIAPVVWWFFRATWRELDEEATLYRQQTLAENKLDLRPAACLAITAVVLTMQEYYGGRQFYDQIFRPWLSSLDEAGHTWVKLDKYDEYYGYVWWVATR